MANNQHFEQKAAELQNDLRTGQTKQAAALLQFAYFDNPSEALALVRMAGQQQNRTNLYVLVAPDGGVSVRERSRTASDPDGSVYAVKMPELLQSQAAPPPPPREVAPPPMPARPPEAAYQPPAGYPPPPEQAYPPAPPPQAMYAPYPQPYYGGPSVGEQIGSALADLGRGIGAVALGVLGSGLAVGIGGRHGTYVQLGGGGYYGGGYLGGENVYGGFHHHPDYRQVMMPPPAYYGMQNQGSPYFGPQQQFSGLPPQYAFAQPVPPPYQMAPPQSDQSQDPQYDPSQYNTDNS
jgi:hypothetical protein